MSHRFTFALLACALALPAAAAALDQTECIAPAKPGGGFDLSCKLVQKGLLDGRFIATPMHLRYLPGGIGAVAYSSVIAQSPAQASAIVAFSGGSLLNLAQGKFGRYTESDVRWLAAIGTDYGAVVVAQDSPYQTLADVMRAMKAEPAKVVLGAGGTIGSQDWMKAALLARAAGANPKLMRFVAFEGGGEAIRALEGGHIHVFTGDAAETGQQIQAGARLRILAVMSDQRLPGALSQVPTAREAGAAISWPIVRGFYLGPRVSDADYALWSETFAKMLATPGFQQLRAERGLFPMALVGKDLERYVHQQVAHYRALVKELCLPAAK
jgi:putative tricarboxylic transport membrane protein